MFRKIYKYLLTLFVAVIAIGCVDDIDMSNSGVGPVPDLDHILSFNIGAETKVSNEDITNSQFVVYDYVDGDLYIDGSQYTLKYSDSDRRWRFYSTDGTPKDFYWTTSGVHKFYAYNKFSFSNGAPTFVYNEGEPKLNLPFVDFWSNPHADLVYASTSRDMASESARYSSVDLTFKHAFSSIIFEVYNAYDTPLEVSAKIINAKHKLEIEGTPSLGFSNDYLDVKINANSSQYPNDAPASVTIPANGAADLFNGGIMLLPQGFMGVGPHLSLSVEHLSSPGKKEEYPELYFTSLGISGLSQGVRYHNVITLHPLHFGLEVTNLERYYDGSDKKSNLTINLTDIAENDIHKIKNLTVTILDGSDNVVGSYTWDDVSSKTLTLSGCGDMPKGEYTIQYAYEDLIGKTYSKTTTFNA